MKPFLTGRKANGHAPLASQVPPPANNPLHAVRSSAAPTDSHPTSHVEVVKQGDKVIRIVVTCACGERTEIECLYPANS